MNRAQQKAACEAYLKEPSPSTLDAAVRAVLANPDDLDLLEWARLLDQAAGHEGLEAEASRELAAAVLAVLGTPAACLQFVAARLAVAARQAAMEGHGKALDLLLGVGSGPAEEYLDRAARWATAAVVIEQFLARRQP